MLNLGRVLNSRVISNVYLTYLIYIVRFNAKRKSTNSTYNK